MVLDRQVADAAPRIEPVGRREGVGRADRRGSARQLPQWSCSGASGGSSRSVRISPRNSQEPSVAADQVGVLALPAEPRLLRQRLLQHRGGVDEHLHLGRETRGEPAGELLEPALEHVVIVAMAGIDRQIAPIGSSSSGSGSWRGPVVQAADDRGAGRRPQTVGRLATVGTRGPASPWCRGPQRRARRGSDGPPRLAGRPP